MKAGDTLELEPLGMRISFLQTAAETAGELLEYEVTGRPRGFPAQAHLHPRQVERHEVLAGALLVRLGGRNRVLGRGESIEIPAGAAHRHYAAGPDEGHVRVQLRPALRTEDLLERLAELSAGGDVTRRGYLKPAAAAHLILDFPDEGRAAQPPAAVQHAFARTVTAFSDDEYVFVDEWDVAAPAAPVFELLADATTYPDWWTPVYLEATSDGPPGLGRASRQHFKGRLPYTLRTRSTITLYEPPERLGADVVGDLRGRGLWTLTAAGESVTHVRFDWRVFADKPIVKVLTPVLRPAFRWNHAWAIARAMEGLEPAARKRAGLA